MAVCSHDIHAISGLLLYLIVPWINLTVNWRLRLLKVCYLELAQISISYSIETKQ